MRRAERLQGDAGASLVLAMAFLVLFGATSVTLLVLTGTSFRVSKIARSEKSQLYAADGGIETGIRMLQTDQVDGTTNTCPAVGTSFAAVGTSTINSLAVTMTCKTTSGGTTSTTTTTGGGSALLSGYTAIFGTSGLVIGGNSGNGAPSTLINGKVYSGGAISAPAEAALRVDGNLAYYQACPPLPANVTLSSGGVCSRPAAPVITAPTVVVPTATAAASVVKTGDATCRIYYPGKYTTAPTFSGTGSYYFASGTYYFAGPGDVNLQGTIFGGAPGAEVKQITGSSPCATDANAQTQNASYVPSRVGSGVTFILGGNGVFRTQDPSKVELYSRIPGTAAGSTDLGATPGVTVWGRTATATNYAGLTNVNAFNTQDKDNPLVIHGLVYLPDSVGQIREPLNPGASAGLFMGGVMMKGLIVDMDGNTSPDPLEKSIGGIPVSTTTTTTNPTRTTLICASAADPKGALLIEAAVTMDPTTPVIRSWRRVTAC